MPKVCPFTDHIIKKGSYVQLLHLLAITRMSVDCGQDVTVWLMEMGKKQQWKEPGKPNTGSCTGRKNKKEEK